MHAMHAMHARRSKAAQPVLSRMEIMKKADFYLVAAETFHAVQRQQHQMVKVMIQIE